ncbi:N-acetylmuramoyl-L-alanine amidase family protein [Bacillus sp. BGMRC 2118]|nr:N-acetylmuramoyl-L-alanine amidase family protein [Bacillus sp. BGMRC 2118]
MKKFILSLSTMTLLYSGISYTAEAASTTQGWVKKSDTWYYYQNSAPSQGWVKDSGHWYYLNKSGAMQTGWIYDGAWYYLEPNGMMATGWIKDQNKWYFMNASGVMQTGWIQDHNNWYYLNTDGSMKTGWHQEGSHWYHLGESGLMSKGWVKEDGNWYYLHYNGVMATGWVNDSYAWYYLYSNGVMAHSTTIDGYTLEASGAWSEVKDDLKLIQGVLDSYGVTAYETTPRTLTFYKGDEEVASFRHDVMIGTVEYRDLLVDLGVTLFPDAASKEELHAAIDESLATGYQVMIREDVNVFFLEDQGLTLAFGGFDTY